MIMAAALDVAAPVFFNGPPADHFLPKVCTVG